MITISDQITLSNITTLEPRCSNVVFENGFVKIETEWEYLNRVTIYNRYLGLQVIMLSPTGNYDVNVFLNLISLGSVSYNTYVFKANLTELSIIQIQGTIVIDSLVSDSVVDALSAAQGKELKRLIDSRYFRHVQNLPASEWIIIHNMGRNPSIAVTDSAGTVVEGVVTYIDMNTLRVNFSADFSGFAELN